MYSVKEASKLKKKKNHWMDNVYILRNWIKYDRGPDYTIRVLPTFSAFRQTNYVKVQRVPDLMIQNSF